VHRCQGCGLVEDRDVAAAQVVANRAAHMLNGSGESRVEDAPVGAPMKPNPIVLRAGSERWESSLVDGVLGPHPSPASTADPVNPTSRSRFDRDTRQARGPAPPWVCRG
jgi:hypothetical protein